MLQPFSWDLLAERGVKVLFLATPHEQSREWVPEALTRGLRVIDLSGAWRLTNAANRAIYGFTDSSAEQAALTQSQAIYGLPELHREQIFGAHLVANPAATQRRRFLRCDHWWQQEQSISTPGLLWMRRAV